MKPLTRLVGASALLLAVVVTATSTAAVSDREAKSAAKMDARALAQLIDREIDKRLASEKIKPAAQADDAEFLRRVYLDLTGVIPPADKARAFLDSKDANKRAKLVDELLASPQYGRHMADIWQSMMLPRTSDNRRLQSEPLIKWLEKNFNENKPWNQLVSDLVTAAGPQNENGAVTFFIANPTADKVTDQVSRLFLGVQLQCAQCHNHPFTEWKQTEYWGMAAFFTKVQISARPNQAARKGTSIQVSESNKIGRGRNKLPESAKIVPAKFFQAEEPKIAASEPHRPVLAKWMTSAQNPFFAKAMVNRTWAQLFGHGFVTPVDDMHEGNPASHPELLNKLAEQFAANNFDLKNLFRAICNSRTYQRSSKSSSDDALFSHMMVKSLTAEQLYDSLTSVLGTANAAQGRARGAAQARGQSNARTQFVAFYNVDDTADATEYQAGIPQVLRLMNSNQFANTNGLINRMTQSDDAPAQHIESLYLATLARRPTAKEMERRLAYVPAQKSEARKAYSDILWALLNSSEFALNH